MDNNERLKNKLLHQIEPHRLGVLFMSIKDRDITQLLEIHKHLRKDIDKDGDDMLFFVGVFVEWVLGNVIIPKNREKYN